MPCTTYGSCIPLISKGNIVINLNQQAEKSVDPTNPFQEDFEGDSEFWANVSRCFQYEKAKGANISWNEIETRLRLERIQKVYEASEQKIDILIWLTTTVHSAFVACVSSNNQMELLDAFVKQLSHFVIILLKEDYLGHPLFRLSEGDEDPAEMKEVDERTDNDRKYASMLRVPLDDSGKVRKSVLHIAGERNFCQIASSYQKLYPGSIYWKDVPQGGIRKRMAVEYALDNSNDAVTCILMKSMTNQRVRKLFEGEERSASRYKLTDIILNPNLKQTVLCVLDSCVNPNFPYLWEDPEKKKEREERGEEAWSKQPGVPLQYNFFFRILDGDENGRPARIFSNNKVGSVNDNFQHRTPSVLQIIANNADNNNPQDPIKHMVVRQLVRQKWMKYGERTIQMYFAFYILFLVLMSTALILGAGVENPTRYSDSKDKIRAICEIGTLLLSAFYIVTELEQFIKEFNIYIKDWYNFFDLIGLALVVILIPCRYAEAITLTRAIGTAAFFINFIRVFKYFPAFKEYGIYAKTFAKIIYTDIWKFSVVFSVVLMAFAGSVYIALCASNSFDDNKKNFWSVFLQELRAISEGKEFSDSYNTYHVLLTLFILTNMFTIIVVLANILIGQLSFRYESAMNDATLQYDIDKARMVTSLERSWFKKWNKRIKHYEDGIFVSDQVMIADLLEDWNRLQSAEGENTEQAIRAMVKRRILKRD